MQIEIHAERNEILDQSSLIMRYQAEIAVLRRQLEEAAQGKGVAMIVDPLHPEASDKHRACRAKLVMADCLSAPCVPVHS